MACSTATGLEKFEEMNAAGLAAVDVTTAYQEKFSEVVVKFQSEMIALKKLSDLVIPGACCSG